MGLCVRADSALGFLVEVKHEPEPLKILTDGNLSDGEVVGILHVENFTRFFMRTYLLPKTVEP